MNKVGKASFDLKEREKMSFHEFRIYLDVYKKTNTEVPKTAIPHSFETVDKI